MEIRPVGGELFNADGWSYEQTDMTNVIVAFRNWANALNETPTHLLLKYYSCKMFRTTSSHLQGKYISYTYKT
jgi:hypothetical protein